MADQWLDVMEDRLNDLEKQVFGASDKDVVYPKDSEQLIDTLANLNNQVNAAVAGKPKAETVLKKLDDLDRYLDPAYVDSLALSQAAKAEIILAEEDVLRQQAENLQKVEGMLDVLSSEHVKGGGEAKGIPAVPSLEGKLHDLNQAHIEQQDRVSGLSEEVKKLLLHYNTVINLMSKQFVQWDELVTKMEVAAQTKKAIDD